MSRLRDALVRAGRLVWELFWGFGLGIVVLWVFFLVMGAVAVDDPLWLTIAMGALGLTALAHLIHEHTVMNRDAELSRRAHTLRERRGF